jgi:hypothetical protein
VVVDEARLPASAPALGLSEVSAHAFGDPPATAAEDRCRGICRAWISEASRQIYEATP